MENPGGVFSFVAVTLRGHVSQMPGHFDAAITVAASKLTGYPCPPK